MMHQPFLLKCPGHNAYFGCTKCVVEGDYLERRKSYSDISAELRTDDNFYSADSNKEPSISVNIPFLAQSLVLYLTICTLSSSE